MNSDSDEELSINENNERFVFDEVVPVRNARNVPTPPEDIITAGKTTKKTTLDDSDSDSDAGRIGAQAKKLPAKIPDLFRRDSPSKVSVSRKSSSESPPVQIKSYVSKRPKSGMGIRRKPVATPTDTESESDDGDVNIESIGKKALPGEYDPKTYENLQVDAEIKEMFQYITKYTPQQLNLDYKFRPFIPDFIPAVGDIDAFLKVVPPEKTAYGEAFEKKLLGELGLEVLDEPAANQSDPALLHLQLRATSVKASDNKDMLVKTVDNVEKGGKVIEKWIKDISDLRKSKPPPVFKYTNPMPDLEELMQQWPDDLEKRLNDLGFPSDKLDCTVSEYLELICSVLDIPVYENKLESIHLLFSLYCAIRHSQANQPLEEKSEEKSEADQLVLD